MFLITQCRSHISTLICDRKHPGNKGTYFQDVFLNLKCTLYDQKHPANKSACLQDVFLTFMCTLCDQKHPGNKSAYFQDVFLNLKCTLYDQRHPANKYSCLQDVITQYRSQISTLICNRKDPGNKSAYIQNVFDHTMQITHIRVLLLNYQ